MTPSQVMYSRQVVPPIEIEPVDRTSDFEVEAMTSVRDNMLSKVASNIKNAQATQKHQYDKCQAVNTYDVRETVLVKNLACQDRKGGHFSEGCNGSYTISRSCGENVYQIVCDDDKVLKKKVNSFNLKTYLTLDKESVSDDTNPLLPPTNRQNNRDSYLIHLKPVSQDCNRTSILP